MESIFVRLLCWVGILNIIFANDHALCIGSMDNNSCSKVARLSKTSIPNYHFIEVGTLVKADDAMLYHTFVVLNLSRIIGKLNCKAKRTIVQNLISLVAIREDELFAIHKRRSTTTKRRTYAIAVETATMVEMERGVEVGIVVFATITKFISTHVTIIVDIISVAHIKFWTILCPNINTKRAFTTLLQRWAIYTVCTTIVFPSYIILTSRKSVSIHPMAHRLWSTFHDSICGGATWFYSSIDKEFTIVCNLVVHLLAHTILHHKSLIVGNAELCAHVFNVNLNELLTLESFVVHNLHLHVGSLSQSWHEHCERSKTS